MAESGSAKTHRAPSGYGAFSFTVRMLRRNRHYRMQGIPAVARFVISLPLLIMRAIRISPFVRQGFSIRDFSPMHIFSHVLGIILVIMCSLTTYTAEAKGASMFVHLPMGALRPFARGIYLSLWIPALILHPCLLGPCIWFWGIVPGVRYIAFSMALVSIYLSLCLFFIDELPFANAFKPSIEPGMLDSTVARADPNRLLCIHSVACVPQCTSGPGTIIIAALAVAAVHFSLGHLEKKIRVNLNLLGFGPQRIFNEVE
jgi:hypothetical protein